MLLTVPAVGAQVLATVGKSTITVEDFNRRYSEARRQGLNPPTREEFLEDLVRLEVANQEAEKLKIQDDPEVKDQIKLLMYERFIVKKLGSQIESIKVSEGELKQFYKKRPELRVAHIFIAGRPEAKKKASEIFAETKKAKRFEDLVKLHSEDLTTREAGGDLGFQSRMTLPSAIYDTALGMNKGEIKGPVETPYGFYILKLLDKRSYEMADKHLLRAAVVTERRTKIFDEYFEKAKKGYKVEINQEALKSAIN